MIKVEESQDDGQQLHGSDIAEVLRAKGPVVKCVLLRAPKEEEGDSKDGAGADVDSQKPEAKDSNSSDGKDGEPNSDDTPPAQVAKSRVLLRDLIEEIELDTTPSKSMVAKTLGGPFTFLGQYDDEGIVLMVKKLPDELPDEEELKSLKLSELRALCKERDIDLTNMLEKTDLIAALLKHTKTLPPFNPHFLQPPLHNILARGDILLLKVAETNEELDTDNPEDALAEINVPTNEEFFLNYTKEEWLKFASRTDIPEHEIDDEESKDDDNEEEDEEVVDTEAKNGKEEKASDEEGEPYEFGEDEELEEEDKSAMFNLVMNEVLRQYREEHGRGPNTKELLELRATIAKELDVQVAHVDAAAADWNKKAKDTPSSTKKIGFHTEDKVLEYHPDPNEHNHHHEDDDYLDNGEQDDDDDADTNGEPPRKRFKWTKTYTDEHPAEDIPEEEDSKPAAIDSSKISAIVKSKEGGETKTSDDTKSSNGTEKETSGESENQVAEKQQRGDK